MTDQASRLRELMRSRGQSPAGAAPAVIVGPPSSIRKPVVAAPANGAQIVQPVAPVAPVAKVASGPPPGQAISNQVGNPLASSQRRRPRVIAIASGKGGVGKSHVAANVAYCIARAGRRTLLIDADLGMANLDLLLGLTPSRNLGTSSVARWTWPPR